MPRPPRLLLAGGIYHVTSRGNRKQPTFREDRDCEQYLATFEVVVVRRKWRCHTYCLMPNHVHLVVETPDPDLSAGIQYLNGSYAQWFNRRHGFEGHLFQGRFHAVLVKSEAHLLELARYVVLNPVRAKLTRDAGSWRWSSYRASVGEAPVPAFLTTDLVLGHFGRTVDEARAAFRRFVRDAPENARGP